MLFYGYVTCTITIVNNEVNLVIENVDGTYTRMLRAVTNKYWRDHLKNEQLYEYIPKIIKSIRMQILGSSIITGEANMNMSLSNILPCQPRHGKHSRGCPREDVHIPNAGLPR